MSVRTPTWDAAKGVSLWQVFTQCSATRASLQHDAQHDPTERPTESSAERPPQHTATHPCGDVAEPAPLAHDGTGETADERWDTPETEDTKACIA